MPLRDDTVIDAVDAVVDVEFDVDIIAALVADALCR